MELATAARVLALLALLLIAPLLARRDAAELRRLATRPAPAAALLRVAGAFLRRAAAARFLVA